MASKNCGNSATPQKKPLLQFSGLRLRLVSALGAKTPVGMAARIVLLAAPLWAVSIISAATSSVTFTEDFEAGDFSGWDQQLCCQHSAQIVSSPTRAGKHAAQFTLSKSDDTRRAELRSVDAVPANSVAWYGFSVYLPRDWATDKGANDIIAQFGARPDRDLGETDHRGGPPLSLVVSDTNFHIVRRWDVSSVTTPKSIDGEERVDIGPYQTGVWTDFVIHVKWTHKPDGFVQVYKDGKLVVNQEGPTNRNDQGGIFFKTGIYKPKFQTQPGASDVTQRVLYYDEVRIGDAGANYQAVAPEPRPISPTSFQFTN